MGRLGDVACRTGEKECVAQLEGKFSRGTVAERHDGVKVSKLKEEELGCGRGGGRRT